MKKILLILLIFSGSMATLTGQSPKREMRAGWLATVWRIDWPSSVVYQTGNETQINAQKQGLIRYLDSIQTTNMNTVFFQVRSRCDAMYNSAYEPWSTDIVATRGMDPGWDPLAFAVAEAHKRGIELHAWLNPYRYENVDGQFVGPQDYRTTHPEWLLDYASGYAILNPALPEVRQRISDVVKDIITKYDVDGIVFDDYFYAYGGTPEDLDLPAQQLYKPADMNVHDWRRKNVNDMVLQVYNMIQQEKPWVTFGISPFGIWTTSQPVATKEGVPLPPGITGGNMYQEIYCDPITWIKKGSVDYVSPQLYWPTTSSGQDYDVLAPWWADVALRFGKHFYSSHTLSGLTGYTGAPPASSVSPAQKIVASASNSIIRNNEIIPLETLSPFEKELLLNADNVQFLNNTSNLQKAPAATNAVSPQEIGLQITRNRLSAKDDAPGSVFFSMKGLYTPGFTKYLRNYMFTHKALTPPINWKTTQQYGVVNNLAVSGSTFTWASAGNNVRYSVYAVPVSRINDPTAINTSEFLKGISYTNSFDITGIDTQNYVLGVAVLDRYGNEYPVRFVTQTSATTTPATTLLAPDNGLPIVYGTSFPVIFSWTEVAGVYEYIFEVAKDAAFGQIIFSRELKTTSFSSLLLSELSNGNTYYWRVKTRKTGATDGISGVRNFVSQKFEILSPTYGQSDVSTEPIIRWGSAGASTQSYVVEVSQSSSFDVVNYSTTTTLQEVQVPANTLISNTTYYVRVNAKTSTINMTTPTVMFKTILLIPDVPVISSPVNWQTINGLNLNIRWNEDPRASSYRVEIAQDNAFPPRATTIINVPAFTYAVDHSVSSNNTYYIRLRANYGTNQYTDWSGTIMVNLTTGLENLETDAFKVDLVKSVDGNYLLSLNTNQSGNANIQIYSVTGSLIKSVYSGYISSGQYQMPLDMNNAARGVYILSIELDGQRGVKRFIR